MSQIGPLTTVLEAVATAVGAGAVLCSAALGAAALGLGSSRQQIAERALTDGYVGGVIGAGFALTDALISYGG